MEPKNVEKLGVTDLLGSWKYFLLSIVLLIKSSKTTKNICRLVWIRLLAPTQLSLKIKLSTYVFLLLVVFFMFYFFFVFRIIRTKILWSKLDQDHATNQTSPLFH